MMLYVVLGTGAVLAGILIAAYMQGRKAGGDRVRVGTTADERRARDEAIEAMGDMEKARAEGEAEALRRLRGVSTADDDAEFLSSLGKPPPRSGSST
jgi:hypothetical protein